MLDQISMKDKRHQMKAGHRAGDSLNSGRHRASMSCSSTPPFSPEWKQESQPSYARMPGLFLHKNLNKLQSPAEKTDSSTYPNEILLQKASVSPIPFLNWIQTMTKVPSTEGNQGYLGKSDGKFSSFSQKGLPLLWRLLLAECQTLNVKEQKWVLVNWPVSRAEDALIVRAFSLFCWALPWTPCRSHLQPRPPVNIPAHPQTSSKPSVSESTFSSVKIKVPLSSVSPNLFLLLLLTWVCNKPSRNSFVHVFSRYLLRV